MGNTKKIGEMICKGESLNSLTRKLNDAGKNSDAISVLREYNSPEDFLKSHNPDVGILLSPLGMRKICTLRSHKLSAISGAYGDATPIAWIGIQISSVLSFSGISNPDEKPIKDCARIILTNYHFLTAAELMYFFARLKAGDYGKLYNSTDMMQITVALSVFCKKRWDEIVSIEEDKIKRAQKKEIEKGRNECVSREEYLSIKRLADKGDKEALRKLSKQ